MHVSETVSENVIIQVLLNEGLVSSIFSPLRFHSNSVAEILKFNN